MNEHIARDVVLMRSIELADRDSAILSEDDRQYASRSARELAQWQAAESKREPTVDHFLEQRSQLIIKRLNEREPAFGVLSRPRQPWTILGVALPVLALLVGFGADRIGDPHHVDVLSAPLLAIMAWNAVVFICIAAMTVSSLFRSKGKQSDWLRRTFGARPPLPRRLPHALAMGLLDFGVQWNALSWGLTMARWRWLLHLSAAMFGLGALLSLYARGLLIEYVAGWESTFLSASDVHALLSAVFYPARMVLGMPGFSLADIVALHGWVRATPIDGARWVHLYAASLLLLVIVPRLLLALFAWSQARRLSRRFPLDLSQPYFQQFSGTMGVASTPAVMRVLPYSLTLDEAHHHGLQAVATMLYGEQASVMLRPPIPYGVEVGEMLQGVTIDDPAVRVTAILFSLAATPEHDNHGSLLDAMVRQSARGIAVLVDESGFVERTGEGARIEERITLWKQFCAFHHTSATMVNLLDPQRRPLPAGTGLPLSTPP